MAARTLTILGSTGSIGTQALEVVRRYPDKFKVYGLCCSGNVELLSSQIAEFKPAVVAVKDAHAARRLDASGVEVLTGDDSPEALAERKVDLVLNALVGISGFLPTVAAIEAGSSVALANKETLVAGGDVIDALCKKHSTSILPVDSEHSAIWQCLDRRSEDAPLCESLILTASGGPFRGKSANEIANASIADALKHPTWNMGLKVTVDSASMMNKGFEIIEAMHLFGVPSSKIDVVVHRQSIVHSMVRFADGSVIAQMSYPDMRLPISLAMLYPERGNFCFEPLSFDALSLDFERPDTATFKCLDLAQKCAAAGGLYPTALNAANEVAVEKFVRGIIKFGAIPYYINEALQTFSPHGDSRNAGDVLAADAEVRAAAQKISEI